MSRQLRLPIFFALVALYPCASFSSPFASNVLLTGTNVSFILNEPAPVLTYSINGGPAVALSGATKGTKTFSLGSPTDKFSISVAKYEPVGYNIPTGATIPVAAGGLSQVTNESGFALISDDTANTVKFNSPRGIAVSNNPNSANFGTAYISNSAAGTTGGRALTGRGIYAVHADQSDAYAQGNAAAQSTLFGTASTNTPFRTFVGTDGSVYVTGFGDGLSGVWSLPADMSTNTQILGGTTGPSALPANQNHGSTEAVYVEGSSAAGNLVMYTNDEDLTTLQATGAGSSTDQNSQWKYTINGAALPYAGGAGPVNMPTKVNATNNLLAAATSDLTRGADGKFYVAQNRAAGAEAGLFILDPTTGATIYDSLTASRTLLANPTAADILRNVLGIAVSDDQKWLAVMLNGSDVAVVPLVAGIPDLANRMVVNTGTDVNSGRDIAFDAADNIHYVSSGQALYRVLSPGGQTLNITSWNGSSYSFLATVPEPTSCLLLLMGLTFAVGASRTRKIA